MMHRGERYDYAGERVIVKDVSRWPERIVVEDDEGFAFGVKPADLVPIVTVPAMSCFLCRRDVSDGDYLNVDFAKDGIQHICSVCWEKRDTDYLEERLDNTDD